jgi:hypothetical protein
MIKSLGRVLWAFITDTWCRHEWENVEEFFIWKHDLWGTEHLTSTPTQPSEGLPRRVKFIINVVPIAEKCVPSAFPFDIASRIGYWFSKTY